MSTPPSHCASFFGCVSTGSNGNIVLVTFTAMCVTHAANQIAPTQVCLVAATEYIDITIGGLVRKTLPIAAAFCPLMVGYYHLLLLLV